MPGPETKAGRHHGVAGRQGRVLTGGRRKLGTGGSMDGAVHTATAGQRGIRGIDDGIDVQGRDVGQDDLQARRHAPRDRS
jgi:hypothetical protein